MMQRSIKMGSFLLILLFVSINFSFGQQGTVSGIVKDAVSGEALIGAYVIVENTSLGDVSDIDGNFTLKNLTPGQYDLKISYIGYQDHLLAVTVDAGKTTKVKIELEFEGIALGAIEVTAQARGQMSAINDQLNSKSIINVISSERIQELPDANAAETVGRISGVSVLRTGGEGSKVAIRGLSPKYNKIMFEGISMAAGEADRSADISMISPYSLDGIEVIKSGTANYDADFIGGAVNFKLRTAPKGKWRYDIVAQGGRNGLKSTISDYMLVGSLSNRFADDKLGIFVQANIERRNRSSNNLLADYNVRNDAVFGESNPVYIQFLRLSDAIRERTRTGATLVFDYKLNDGFIHFKNIYNSGITNVDRYNQIFNVNSRKHIYEARAEQYNLDTYTNILGFEKRLGALTINAKVSHSFASSIQPGTLSFTFEQDGALASAVKDDAIAPAQIFEFATIDNSNTFFNRYQNAYFNTEERNYSGSVDLTYDFSISRSFSGNIQTGIKFRAKDRFHDRDVWGGDLKIASGQSANDAILNAFPWMEEIVSAGNRLPYTLFNNEKFDHQNFLEGTDYSVGAVADLDLMREVLQVLETDESVSIDGYFNLERSSNTYDYSGTEQLQAGYLMSELRIGKKIQFIPGFRYEKNETSYTGIQGVTNIAFAERNYVLEDTTTDRENSFLLPMMHLKISPFDWFDIRAAYTQTLSRPSYGKFMPRRDIWGNNVSFNNFRLRPEHSTNIDLFLSFHENHIGLFTIGAFSKKIDDVIFNLGKRVILDPSEYSLGSEYRFKSVFSIDNNEEPTYVRGLEADWQMNFWFLKGALQGLVLNINYTHIFSEAQYPLTKIENLAEFPWDPPVWQNIDTFYTSPLVNQPDDIFNIQLGYDYKGFSARLSMLYQSSTFKKPEFWPELSYFSDDYLRWDLSLKQKLPWNNMQVFCNINNISSAQNKDLVKGASWDASIQDYGATIDIGLRMRLNK